MIGCICFSADVYILRQSFVLIIIDFVQGYLKIASSGRDFPPGGGAPLSGGRVFSSSGGVFLPIGGAPLPRGGVFLSSGRVFPPSGRVFSSSGGVFLPIGGVPIPRGRAPRV